jgi:hypothetical protein
MKPSDVSTAVNVLIDARQPVFLWGPPGVGKSAIVRKVASVRELELIDVRAVLLDPVDLRGLPHVNGDNRAHWCTPDFLPREGHGLLFLDELNAAPQLVQAACYQLILDRKLGEYALPEGWDIIAAGNRDTDRAVTSRMPSALANRFVHLQVEPDLGDWTAWALDAGMPVELIAFLRFRPSLLHAFDPAVNAKAFPTPRSWEFVGRIMASNPADSIRYDLFVGTVGEAAAAELLGFLRIFESLPNRDAVLMNPMAVDVPVDPAVLYALCGSLVKGVTTATIDNLFTFAGRLPAEFSVLLVKDVLRADGQYTNTRGYIDWSVQHQDVLS